MVIQNDAKIYHRKCKICGKEMVSLSEQQINYNYTQHYESCIRKEKEREEKLRSKLNGGDKKC